jgi:hypothetical protein
VGSSVNSADAIGGNQGSSADAAVLGGTSDATGGDTTLNTTQKGWGGSGTGGDASASANGGAATSGPAVVNNSAWVDQHLTQKAKVKVSGFSAAWIV